jgi:hypothetical protein
MSGVFRNIDPPSHHGPASVYPSPPPLVLGEETIAGWRGGGGSIVRKTPDTYMYSKYFVRVDQCCVVGDDIHGGFSLSMFTALV